jgi:protein-S-isoprenylcysteine O-methyltransferase Ste14
MLKALSMLGYLAMVGGLLGLLVMKKVFFLSPFVIAPQVAGTALMLWARFTFGRRSFHVVANPTEGGLVTTGPYRFIRHPIYAGMCLFATPGAVSHPSPSSILLCALIWVAGFARMFCEERLLCARYPEYRHYAASTPRVIPFLF